MLTGNKIGNGEGVIFEDWDIKNLCIVESDDVLFLVGQESGTNRELKIIKLGSFDYAFRIKYYVDFETVAVQRSSSSSSTSSSTFKVSEETELQAHFLTAYFHTASDYEDIENDSGVQKRYIYPYLVAWSKDGEGDFEITVGLSQSDSACFTPCEGRLEDVEICIDFSVEGVIDMYGDGVFVARSRRTYEDYSRIAVVYSSQDSILRVSEYTLKTGVGDELYIVPALDVLWIVYEGDLPTQGTGELTLTVDKDVDEDYYCVTFRSILIARSALYPVIQGMCIICEDETSGIEERNICLVYFYLYDDSTVYTHSNFTLSGDSSLSANQADFTFDLESDMFKITFTGFDKNLLAQREYTFTKFTEEIVEWAESPLDYPIVSLNSQQYQFAIQSESGLYDSFHKLPSLSFDAYNEGWGIFCNEYRCILGFVRQYLAVGAKVYTGRWTNLLVTAYGDNEEELICLGLGSSPENLGINDCQTKDQWRRYQNIIPQYPVWTGLIMESDYPEED